MENIKVREHIDSLRHPDETPEQYQKSLEYNDDDTVEEKFTAIKRRLEEAQKTVSILAKDLYTIQRKHNIKV